MFELFFMVDVNVRMAFHSSAPSPFDNTSSISNFSKSSGFSGFQKFAFTLSSNFFCSKSTNCRSVPNNVDTSWVGYRS